MTTAAAPAFIYGDTVVDELQPKQLEALRATPILGGSYTHIGYGGAAGAGKSRLARAVARIVAEAWPGSVCGIFRRTYPELRENHIVPFREEGAVMEGDRFTYKSQQGVAEWANGSRTVFGYLRHDHDVFQYQGLQFDVMIFEEATHQTWYQVQWLTGNRLRANGRWTHNGHESRPFALYPSNPGNVGHFWYKRLFIDRNFRDDLNEDPSEYTFIQARLQDNAVLMERDPLYLKRLNNLPEPLRSQLRDGDWEAGSGLALQQLRRDVHIVEPFTPPSHWYHWGAFDWGFQHPFAFGLFCTNEDGVVYLVDSVMGRHLHDPEIIERIQESFPPEENGQPPMWQRLKSIHAGVDAWNDHVAVKGSKETGENTAERFNRAKLPMVRANVSRISGLRNLREYVKHSDGQPPRFFIMDTPTNMKVFEQLEGMVVDPDRMEDALKVDADEFGEGGDDGYDMVRYGLMARPLKVRAPEEKIERTRNRDVGLERLMERINKERNRRRR